MVTGRYMKPFLPINSTRYKPLASLFKSNSIPVSGDVKFRNILPNPSKTLTVSNSISDYSLVENSSEISNIRFTPKDLIDTHHIITLIMKS